MADTSEMAEVVSEEQEKNNLTKKNIIGYAMGDLGGCMTFAVLGSFLTSYYTDVAGMSTATVSAMYIILKVWDAINDPLMGVLMDKLFATNKHPEKGKFRPWMFRATPLLLITSILMYTAPSFVEGTAQVVVAFLTYLVYEASYTIFNIPYGSLLSAMAHNDIERSTCSSARGFGSVIGNIIPLVLFPLIIDAFTENEQLGYALGITICAVIGFICCLISCYWTCERLTPQTSGETDANNIKFSDIIVVFKKNRAFDALCLQGLFYCIAQYMASTLGVYLYRDVYDALTMYSVMSVISMVISCILVPIVPNIAKKYGLERTVRYSQLISVVLYVCNYFFSPNVYMYMLWAGLAQGLGGITVLQQWGMVGEAIDYNEYVTGKRTEGSIYGVFNLMRRIGQAIGSSAAAGLLGVVGYDATLAAQTATTQSAILGLITLVPAVCMLGCWIALKFVWNITPEIRAKMNAYQAEKAAKAAEAISETEQE